MTPGLELAVTLGVLFAGLGSIPFAIDFTARALSRALSED